MGFFSHLKALLKRYHLCYFRIPGHFVADFTIAFIIGGTLASVNIFPSALSGLALLIYVILVPFTFMSVTRSMLGEIVFEKSSKLKEFLKLNGLGDLTYQFYNFIIVFGKVMLFTLMITLGLIIAYFFQSGSVLNEKNMEFGAMMELYILGGLATSSSILVLSTVFSDPKFASDIGAFFYIIVSLGSIAVILSDNPAYYFLVSLFPQSALTLGIMKSTQFRGNLSAIGDDVFTSMLLLDFVVYLVIYSYLDQVIPDGNGVRKPYLFFLQFRHKSRISDSSPNAPLLAEGESPNQDTSSARYHQAFNNQEGASKNLEIVNLKREFGGNFAVNGVSFSIYEKQILCLLGHNGAGKTTTINMLTGLLEPTSGDVLYDGVSFFSNVEEARSKIGLCSQHDILYNKMTVREHLFLIGQLRNIPNEILEPAVNDSLKKMNLIDEQNKFTENISGGNKRKLSLAMAVIGRVKVLLLDEPTSGMDPQNRRIIWQDIRNLKESGLTILMTTHHLDEAEELADRVAIMSKGMLLALGSSDYIKRTFGEGYYLTITPNFQTTTAEAFSNVKQKVRETVLKIVEGSKTDDKTPPDVLKVLLPFTGQAKFHSLFKELEGIKEVKFSMQMNSLEDTFVNIGLKEDEFLGIETHESVRMDLPPPSCFAKPPVYDFGRQVKVIFLRKAYITLRSLRNIVLVILPGLLVLAAAAGQHLSSDPTLGYQFFIFILTIAFALNSAAYCAFPVYEREDKLKYAMDVMGVRPITYWLGTLLFDMLCVLFINLMSLVSYIVVYNRVMDYLNNPDNNNNNNNFITSAPPAPLDIFALSLPFSYSVVTFCYMWSFAFDKALSAVKYFPLIFYFVLYLGSSIILTIIATRYVSNENQIKNLSNNALFKIITYISYFICPVLLYNNAVGDVVSFFPSFVSSIGEYAVIFMVLGTLYFLLVFWYDSKSNKFKPDPIYQTNEDPINALIDHNEIAFEANRANNSQTDTITVQRLTKQFGVLKAVKDITFGVEPGQIFGLLGPNGAGKSTTFNILTTLVPKTQGSVRLLGREVSRGQPDLYQNVGICPQFNCLWDTLSVQEHLELFAGLKGLSTEETNESIRYFYETLALGEHKSKKSMHLSGGNKRKLCVANCLMGSSSLLFFDEPSTGLDPLARRFLWGALQQTLKVRRASIVLTTHSMNEAESLSHKIGILVNGRFFCVGPTEYLKDKYGQGYKITVQINQQGQTVEGLIKSIFPLSKKLWDGSLLQETYEIPANEFLFSFAFEKLGELKQSGTIKDFSLYNTTLEQVFIHFSKFQYTIPNQQS